MKDFFNECAKQDEVDIQNAIRKEITDPFFDIRIIEDSVETTIDNILSTDNSAKTELSANKALIRRFNFHSIMVLDACRSDEERGYKDPLSLISSDKKKEKETVSEPAPLTKEMAIELEEKRSKAKKRRLKDAIEYDDLEGKKPAVGSSIDEFDEGVQPPKLNVVHEDRYMHGPTPLLKFPEGFK